MPQTEYETRVVGVGPLVQELLCELQVVEVMDDALNYQPEIGATYGELSQAVIINRMSFAPKPLYAMSGWAAESGVAQLLGLDASWLDDDRLGAMLEGLADHQVDIWRKIVGNAVAKFGLVPDYLNADTTSIYFEGSYENEDGTPKDEANGPLLVEGYNKDGKRKKAQYVLSLVNCGRVPLWYKPWDGNQTDDGVYLSDLRDLSKLELNLANAVLIAVPLRSTARKLCNKTNLLDLSRCRQQFLAPHPWWDTAKQRWLATWAQLETGELSWTAVDYVARNQEGKAASVRPQYKVCEDPYLLVDKEHETTYDLRWLFSWSSDKAAADQQKRAKAVQLAHAELERIQGLLGKYDYKSRKVIERRIENRLRKVGAARYFNYTLTGTDAKQKWRLKWQLVEPALAESAKFDGIALFCTNVPQQRLTAPEAIIKYKTQIHVEQSIAFIKSPIHIRPMWLHSPRRIAGLTLLIMIAVLLASLLEFQVRRHLAATGQLIHGLMPEKRDNPFPTATKLLQAFHDYSLVIIRHPDGSAELVKPTLRPVQQHIWDILQLAFSPP